MGKLYVVGFGPGDAGNMTKLSCKCLRESDVIIGYTAYIERLRPLFPDKDYYETRMGKEVERCCKAIELVESGKTASLVSSGDSGVYGMASLVYELAEKGPEIEIEVIPGVTAAVSGAALLGAPIGHDFVVISLSNLLTPWEIIEKRLRAAAEGDFVLCLYNPGSKQRAGHLRAACNILLEKIPEDRLCGIARNIAREGQSISITTLGKLRTEVVGMTEIVFIGNTGTRNIGGRMVTPRGYGHD